MRWRISIVDELGAFFITSNAPTMKASRCVLSTSPFSYGVRGKSSAAINSSLFNYELELGIVCRWKGWKRRVWV